MLDGECLGMKANDGLGRELRGSSHSSWENIARTHARIPRAFDDYDMMIPCTYESASVTDCFTVKLIVLWMDQRINAIADSLVAITD